MQKLAEMKKLNRLAKVMVAKGKAPYQIAALLSIKVKTVERWCRNEEQPSLYSLVRIAEYLNVCVTELLEPTKITKK